MREETEACYWCSHIQTDSTKSMNVTGWCSKHHKTVDLEQEGCNDFAVYESLKRMMRCEFVFKKAEAEEP